ncbi:13149_t:CDS:2 [Funneliformis mosseae]|uniref:magnesium chelatase n=1 Tax=Funneliformis mosseae TaxID=27381 RepID=A0A9N9DAB6_FUNMO|nr:13149_t:CDS:2 [Funneliformis mosseae]
MLSETTKNWLKSKLQYIRKNTYFQFSDDVLISILVCLISGEKHLILTCKPEDNEELRSMTKQVLHHVFNMTTVICDASQTPAEFTNNLFSRQREDIFHISNSVNNVHSYPDCSEEATLRLKSYQSLRSLRTISSTKSNDKRPMHEFQGLNRRSNLSHSSNLIRDNIAVDSDESLSLYGSSYDNDEIGFLKSKERLRTFDSPRETTFSLPRSSSLHTRKRNINLSSSPSQPIDISEKPSTSSRPSLSIYTGSPRKNIHHSYFSSSSQSPNDYTFSKKRHESLSTSGFDPPSPYIPSSRPLAKAVIIENLLNADETIYALLLEILIRRQVIDRSTVYNLPKSFLVIVLLPMTSMKYNLPNQLGVEAGKSPIITAKKSPLIKPAEIEDLSKKMDNVTIHNDMHRYMRDVVVGIRTHRLVKGGLTARASSDLVTLVRALAAVFQRNYATPELVLFASEKIFSHRLILRDAGDDKSTMYGTSLFTLLRARSLSPKFPSPGDVVADVLQTVWPPI